MNDLEHYMEATARLRRERAQLWKRIAEYEADRDPSEGPRNLWMGIGVGFALGLLTPVAFFGWWPGPSIIFLWGGLIALGMLGFVSGWILGARAERVRRR